MHTSLGVHIHTGTYRWVPNPFLFGPWSLHLVLIHTLLTVCLLSFKAGLQREQQGRPGVHAPRFPGVSVCISAGACRCLCKTWEHGALWFPWYSILTCLEWSFLPSRDSFWLPPRERLSHFCPHSRGRGYGNHLKNVKGAGKGLREGWVQRLRHVF